MNNRFNKVHEKVEQWFVERGLDKLDGIGQLDKLKEEVQELIVAREANDIVEEIDAIGDILVVLCGYCVQRDYDLVTCLEVAYEEIKDRKGYVNDQGVFVKEM